MANALMRVEKLASRLNKEGVEEALRIVNELYEELLTSIYSAYVSATIDNLRFVREQLEQATQEFSW